MKQLVYTALLVMACLATNAQDLLLGRSVQVWDSVATAFIQYDSLQNIYDINHNLTQTVVRRYGNPTPGVWNYVSKKDYTYDGQNRNIELFEYIWSSGAWQNSKHETFEFDGNGDMIRNIKQDYTGGTFQNTGKLEYTYLNNVNTEYVYYSWTSGAWQATTKWQYKYNTNGVRDTSYLYANLSGWQLFSRYIYQHNAQDLVTQTLIQDWNSSSSTWENDFLDNTTYNAQNKTTAYNRANWGGVIWNWDKEWRYTYAADLYLTGTNLYNYSLLNFSWYIVDSTVNHLNGNNLCDYEVRHRLISGNWEYSDSVSHLMYDAHSNLTHDVSYVWSNNLSNWKPYRNTYWWYLPGTTGIEEAEFMQVKVYPNPAADLLGLEFMLDEPSDVSAELIAVNGQKVKTLYSGWQAQGMVKYFAPVNDLSTGTYVLQVTAGSKTFSRMVILR